MNWKIYMRGRFLGYVRAHCAISAVEAYAAWSGVWPSRLTASAQ